MMLMLACYDQVRRKHPYNMICLTVFTLAMGSMVAMASAAYATDVVLLAAGITAGVTVCLTLYALQTKRDFTAAGGILFALLFILVVASILGIFIRNSWLRIAVSAAGALLFAAYIIYDVQLMTGTGQFALSPDEYVLAALNIYLDIINLFLHLTALITGVRTS